MVLDVLPHALIIAVGVQVSCQLVKFVTASVRSWKLRWDQLVTPGGMPSAHSAFVTSLTASIGVYAGLNSNLFALAAVFGAIVVFDAYKLRGNVQKQAVVVNRLQQKHLEPGERVVINEMVGHTPAEIIAGVVYALVVAIPAALLWT
jgi:acid phosphatase family membrane protein YuiD